MSKPLPWLAAALSAAALLSVGPHVCPGAVMSPAERKIEKALETRLDPGQPMEFFATPLRDIATWLGDFFAVNIQLDTRAFEKAGVDVETPITKTLKDVSLRSALELMLTELNLSYVVQDEVLLITTSKEAASRLFTRTYPIPTYRILSSVEERPAVGSAALVHTITSSIDPTSWKVAGGPGSIVATRVENVDYLVVLQTYHVHHKMADLLEELQLGPAVPKPPQPVRLTAEEKAREKITRALKSFTKLDVRDTPLRDVADELGKRHGIEIELDLRALDEAGVDLETPITKKLEGITLRSALRLLLRDLDLTYMIQDEVLLITSTDAAQSRLITTIYPVTDLVLPTKKITIAELVGGAGGFAHGDAMSAHPMAYVYNDFEALIDLIMSTVRPETWDTVGGPGSISEGTFRGVDVLVISQTEEVHEEIAALLERLRAVVDRGRLTTERKLAEQTKAEMLQPVPEPASPAKPPAPAEKKSPSKRRPPQPVNSTADPFGSEPAAPATRTRSAISDFPRLGS